MRMTRVYRVFFKDNYGYLQDASYVSDYRNNSKKNREDAARAIIRKIGYKRYKKSEIVSTWLDD